MAMGTLYKVSRKPPAARRSKYVRRRYKKRGTYKRRTTGLTRGVGFNDTQMVKLRYVGNNLQLTTGVTPAYRLFRGNSINDPDQTGAGHQPLGHDQWANFYDRYIVYGCKYKFTFVNGGTNDHLMIGVIPKDENTVINPWSTLAERQYAKIKYMGTASAGSSIKTISGYMSTKKILGLQHVGAQDVDYTAAMNNNPANQWYVHAYAQAVNEVSAFTVFVNVELTYYCRLYDRKPLAQS